MKLKDLTNKVINYLKKTKKPKSAIEITKGINLPIEKKRRIYDIIDVLHAANYIKITRKGNEKFINLIPVKNEEVKRILDNEMLNLENKQFCFMNLDLIFSPSDFKTLKNPTWQDMILRDIKRQVKGLMDLKINDVKLIENSKIIID